MAEVGEALLDLTFDASEIERARLLMARMPERLIAALQKANRLSGAVLLRQIKLKLSNDVLHVRTGNLRRNWHQIMPVREEGGWGGGAGSGKTEYAAYHEFGLNGDVSVRAHSRRVTQVYGRPVSGVTADVRAHSRHVNYAGRPYARPAFGEVKERVQAIHKDEIRQAAERAL